MSKSALPAPHNNYHRRQCLRAAVACVAAASPLLSRAQGSITIRFSHIVAEQTPKGLAVSRFKELLEQRTNGRIRVVVYPDAQLYGDNDEVQALHLGAVEMLAPSLSKFGRMGFPEFELFDLPFWFDEVANVRRVTQGPLGQQLMRRLDRQQLMGLGFFDNGFKQMSANRPLLEPADFRGLRMRVQSSRVIAQQMRALGAQPITLAFGEARRALASGVVDGTENPLSNFWTQGMHEVQSDLSLTQHGYLGYAVVANQRFWHSMGAPDQSLVGQAMQEALAYGNAIADAQNESALASLRLAGTTRIHTPTPEQRARLRKAVEPVHLELASRIGTPWLAAVRDALDKRT